MGNVCASFIPTPTLHVLLWVGANYVVNFGLGERILTIYPWNNITPRQPKYQKIASQCERLFYSDPYPPYFFMGGCDLG